MNKVGGIIIEGFHVASGTSKDSPYPESSIKLQVPYFKNLGLDISEYFIGTLNVNLSPYSYNVLQADHHFSKVNWYQGVTEDFSFIDVKVEFNEKVHEGYIYYPHPETKPLNDNGTLRHLHKKTTLELIMKKIEGINYGDKVIIEVDPKKVEITNEKN
eukprot:TRINITY_DN650_c0_g1_i2.p1 TRINITY_DN650_c0_g1~~TRINITY_DN650_c0_g1_i2.p1  ORF type:complete len:158 (-),score=29.36 TRINITY_DN650_c0_g1_i2:19-492(-)